MRLPQNRLVPAEEIIGSNLAETVHGLHRELERARTLMRSLLKHVGTPGTCRGCGALIIWVNHTVTSRRYVPYDLDGLNHFATCGRAAEFKRKEGLDATATAGTE